jgi:hypothetical protein
MKYNILTLLLIIGLTSNSQTDSILFSKNGKFVLVNNKNYVFLNACPCKYRMMYEREKNEAIYYVTFFKDSVYFLTYDKDSTNKRKFKTINPKTGEECSTFADISNSMSLSDYENEYQLNVYSKIPKDIVTFRLDTLNKYKVQYYKTDSSLYYNIKVIANLNDIIIMFDTIKTNIPEINVHYRVYYSVDEKYYFVTGLYSYKELQFDNDQFLTLTLYINKELNKIGILNKNNR